MSNIKWEDGAVCFADDRQWFASKEPDSDKFGLVNDDGRRKYSFYGMINFAKDFQLNEIRTDDYIEASELGTEQKYNDIVDVFGLFGFEKINNIVTTRNFNNTNFSVMLTANVNQLLHVTPQHPDLKRKLTYSQLMAIGRLKRAIELTKDIGGNKMSKFNVGDKVIRTLGSSTLSIGKKYTIKEVNERGLILKGYGNDMFNPDSFKLVEDTSKHHKHHDLIIAWAKGAEIEAMTGAGWSAVSRPAWSIDNDYRIKPEPNPEKENLKDLIADMKEQLEAVTKRLEELE